MSSSALKQNKWHTINVNQCKRIRSLSFFKIKQFVGPEDEILDSFDTILTINKRYLTKDLTLYKTTQFWTQFNDKMYFSSRFEQTVAFDFLVVQN